MKHTRIRTWVKVLFISIIIITTTLLYSKYIEPKCFKVKEYGIVDSKLPDNFYGFKIVQISDILYKSTTDKDSFKKIVKEINLLKPDIVILSGDLFDSSIKYSKNDFSDLEKVLKDVDVNIEKFAIKGDNDLKFDKWESIINNSGFIDLNDKYEYIYNESITPILLIGISSNYKDNHIKDTINSMYEQISTEYNYSILVLHEPDFINKIDYSKFNLILAGHSLNGRIKIPFIGGIIKNKYSKKYFDEYYDLGSSKMYISSGIGTDKYKFRFLNSPSINFFRLRNK